MKKKILFVATVENHILHFHIPFIQYFQGRGYEVHVAACLGERADELARLGVFGHHVNFSRSPYSWRSFYALGQLVRLMRRHRFSLVHVHTPMGAFLGRLAARLTGTSPVLYTAHGFHFFRGAPLVNWLVYYPMEWLAARWTDGLITMNREDFLSAGKLPLRCRGAVFFVHGVGLSLGDYGQEDEAASAELRQRMGFAEDDLLLLVVGELIKRKNQSQIINALPKVLAYYAKAYLLLVGSGNNEEILINQVQQKGLHEHVHFLGYRRDVPALLNATDIVMLTSLHEGLPRCIMEAMAAGRPVIATDVRGNRDLVQDRQNGFLVPVGDIEATARAILALARDRQLARRMGEKGRELIGRYAIENVLQEMDAVYSKYLVK